MANSVSYDFDRCRVLVTGGTSGIGLAIASAFAGAGAAVTVTGTRSDPSAYGVDLSAFAYEQLDTGDTGSVDTLTERMLGGDGALDVLVNNAGANFPGGRDEWTPDGFAAAVALNLVGPMRLTVGLEPLLAASTMGGGASVVFLASMAAYRAVDIVPGYAAAKAGVVNLTGTLARRWVGRAIRVNAVAPGVIETPMTAPMASFPELLDAELAHTPMGRLGAPSEVADAVLFLSSSAASYVTGHTLAVDGGYLLP